MTCDAEIARFLRAHGWDNADAKALTGDASARRYSRLRKSNETCVFMYAPPAVAGDQREFARIGEHLSSIGLKSPAVLATDFEKGLLLIEDLGDLLFPDAIRSGVVDEVSAYGCAANVLVPIQTNPAPTGLPMFGPAEMAAALDPFFDEAVPGHAIEARTAVSDALFDALNTHCSTCNVMILRDHHAENILWQSNENALRRVGLIDFQDAMMGHAAYDLVSLLMDARRDVPSELCDSLIDGFVSEMGLPAEPFRAAFATLTAQRNLRILGIFARLKRDGHTKYERFVPRVKAHISDALGHPALSDLRAALRGMLPDLEGNGRGA